MTEPIENTAADPIQAAIARLANPPTQAHLARLLRGFLSSELLVERTVRLEQVGDRSGRPALLADLFVDLHAGPPQRPGETRVHVGRARPLTRELQVERRWRWPFDADAEDEGEDGGNLPPALLSTLAAAPDRPFRGGAPGAEGVPCALLLTGGPGWGKSTLGQMLCQVHRANLLTTVEKVPAIEKVRDSTLAAAAAFAIVPAVARFPVRIVLSAFADWLAEEEQEANEAVLRYVAARVIKRLPRARVEAEGLARDLERLLCTLPSLFVFDGLDEVAETAGRPDVLTAIQEFSRRLEEVRAPAVLMLTSRPAPVPPALPAFVEWRIRPLSRARALRQAAHLVGLRYKNDADRLEEVAARLVEAWGSDTLRPLLQVPLHVALTVVLVDAVGRLPEERWRLFDEHYRVLYQRELEKPTEAADILREHRPLIDAVHQRVSLLLQVEGERAGGSRSMLSRERLNDVINAVLEDEIDEPERSALVVQVMAAATDRLVLLTRLEESPDRYGFELRSLQEHFAAEAMFAGREAHVMDRLRRIAFAPAFRNVLLIAASKIDAKSEMWHLRASIADLCAPHEVWADENPIGVLRRAELALDLLEDGFPHRSKKLTDRVVEAALSLLRFPACSQLLRMTWMLFGRAEAALRARLEEVAPGESPDSMAFWLVLVELAESGVEWAMSLGDAHWPEGEEARRAIVRAAVHHWARLGSWLGRKIGASPGSFPPSFVNSLLGGMVHVEMQSGDVPEWLESCIVRLWEAHFTFHSLSLRIPLLVPGLPSLSIQLVRSTRPPETPAATENMDLAQEDVPQMVAEQAGADAANPLAASTSGQHGRPQDIHPVWRPFVVAVAFAAEPSPEHLAGALNTLAAVEDAEALRWAEQSMPWVLRMCMQRARTPEHRRAMASALAEHPLLFGNEEDWSRAEEAWLRGITMAQIAPSEWPPRVWDGAWFPEEAAEVDGARLMGWRPPQIADFIAGTFPKEDWRKGALAAKLGLAALLEVAYYGESSPVLLEPAELEELVRLSEMTTFAIATVVPLHLEGSGNAAWPAALDRIARSLPVAPLPMGAHPGFTEYLAQCWSTEPTHTGLLRWLAENINRGWVPPAGMTCSPGEFDTPQSRLDAWGLRLADGFSEEEAPELARHFATDVRRSDPSMFAHFGAERGIRQRCSPEARRGFARALLLYLPLDLSGFLWRTFAIQLLEMDRPTPSGLDERALWTELDLPLPLPWRPPSSPPPGAAAGRIEGVRLHHVRGLRELTLPIPNCREGQTEGRWIVLLGENGVGKSTVLRAVALALLDPQLGGALVRSSLAGYVAHERDTAIIEVTIPDRKLSVSIARDSGGTETFSTVEAPRPLVFAYGCRRSSALGGAAQALSFRPNDRVATLFDEGADLIHAETWLKNRAFAAGENSREKVLLDEVKKALLRAMPGIQAIDVKPDGVWLYGPAIGRTGLAGLSDGYLTMMGWIVDLVARWTEIVERKKQVIEPSFMQQMEGVVLLDELDLHLHPRWQIRVIDDLRELFPRMTFLVTTHNPLTLLGARNGEVIILRRAERPGNGEVAEDVTVLAEQHDLRPGLTIDQVLTGAWFGLSSTLDQGTLALLERHGNLLREGRAEEDPERLDLERELRLRLGRFADTSIERLAQRVAAELTPRATRDLGPQEREALRMKIRETVAVERAAAAARKAAVKG